jgi:hypothetical protein
MAILLGVYIFTKDYVVTAQEDTLVYNDETWDMTETTTYEHGKIVYYSNNVMICNR